MPGLAAKLLAKKDSKVLAIIGPGVINKACLMAILSKMDQIDTVMIKGTSTTSRSTLEMKRFIEEKYPQIKQITLCETLEEAIRPADIVSERYPVVRANGRNTKQNGSSRVLWLYQQVPLI